MCILINIKLIYSYSNTDTLICLVSNLLRKNISYLINKRLTGGTMEKILIQSNDDKFKKLINDWRKNNCNISQEIVKLILVAECSGLIHQVEEIINIH